jgi:broad specificity phosphatase PhoE
MTNVIFVRHGESESNVFIHADPNDAMLSQKICAIGDPKLSNKGHLQANDVGEFLVKKLDGKKVRVLTSLFTRTIQTSQPFCDAYKDNIELHEHTKLLCEYTKPLHQLSNDHKSQGLEHHHTWEEFTNQVEDCVDLLESLAQCSDTPIVVFGHSLFLSVLVSYLGSSKTMVPEKQQLTFRFPNCSITTLCYSQGSWKIFNVGSIAHIPVDHITGTECPYGHF